MKNLLKITAILVLVISMPINSALAAVPLSSNCNGVCAGISQTSGGYAIDNTTGSVTLLQALDNSNGGFVPPAVINITGSNSLTIGAAFFTGVPPTLITPGAISGSASAAIVADNFANGSIITNYGTISNIDTCNANAINLGFGGIPAVNGGKASVVNGNQGIISTSGLGAAIQVGMAGPGYITGDIINYAGGTIQNLSSGYGIRVDAPLVGKIDNAGNITANTGNALYIGNRIAGNGGGYINNSGTITSSGDASAAVFIVNSDFGILNNSGTIQNSSAIASNPIALQVSGISSGDIINSGAIQTTNPVNGGIAIYFTGTIGTFGTLFNTVTGTISTVGAAGGNAIKLDPGKSVNINNAGSITSPDVAIYSEGNLTLVNSRTGTISGDVAIYNFGNSTITNSGKITTTGTAAISNSPGINPANLTINNSGTISATGISGAAIVSGDPGATIVNNSGTIQGSGGSSAISISGLTPFNLNNSGKIIGDINADNTNNVLNINGTSGNSMNGNINLGGGVDVINFGSSSDSVFTTGGTIDTNKIDVKFGTLNVSNKVITLYNAATPGVIDVDNGAILNFSRSAIHSIPTINVNGTLSVSAGQVANTGGVVNLMPNINAPGGVLKFDIQTANNYGRIVGTNLTFSSGTSVDVGIKNIGYIADKTTLSHVYQGVPVGFLGFNVPLQDTSYVYKFTPRLSPLPAANGIDIYVERENSLASAAPKDQNLVAMGNFLESLGNPADPKLQGVISSLYNKSTAKEVADSMSTLFPNTSGGDVQAAASSLNASIGTIESHLELATNSNSPTNSFTGNDRPVSNGIWGQTFGNGYGNRALVDNKIGVGVGGYPVPPAAPPISSGPSGNPVKNSAWTEGFGSIISQSKRDGIEGYNANVFGFSFGADLYASPTATFGIAAAYGKTASDGNSSPNSVVSSTNSKTFESTITSQQISVYGTRNFGRTYVDLITAFAWNHYQSKRVLFDGSVAQRDSKGNQMTFKLNIGHAIETAKDTFVSPFASIQYTDLMQDSYIETGSNANLKVNPKDLKVLKSGLGFKVSSGPKLNGVNGRFFAGWYHDFYAQSVEITSSFASAPAPSISFNSKGASVPPDSVRAGLGFDLINKDGVAFSIDYIVEAKPQFIAHTGVARLKFAF